MAVESLDHINIRTPDIASTCRFFVDVLQMEIRDTPGINDRTRAAWICDELGRPVVHVVAAEMNFPDEQEPKAEREGSGRVHHVALRCRGYDEMTNRLSSMGCVFRTNVVPDAGLRQLFVTDPNGILVELNFFAG